MNNPKVSIIMPTYNRAGIFLQKSIQSVLIQDYTDFEFIILDDCSTDNTQALVSKFKDSRIVYIKTTKNHGEYWSTNKAVSIARGKYLTWIHSDDMMAKNSLTIRVNSLDQHSNLDFVHGNIIKIDENDKEIEQIDSVSWPKAKILEQYLLPPEKKKKKYLVHHLTVMMKTNFYYLAGPFDGSLPFAGDIDWLIRAIRIGRFINIAETLYLYRTHKNTRRVLDRKAGIDVEAVNEMIRKRYFYDFTKTG